MFKNKVRQLRQWFANRELMMRLEDYPEYLLQDVGLQIRNGKLERRPPETVFANSKLHKTVVRATALEPSVDSEPTGAAKRQKEAMGPAIVERGE